MEVESYGSVFIQLIKLDYLRQLSESSASSAVCISLDWFLCRWRVLPSPVDEFI